MTTPESEPEPALAVDAAVVGGGLAGLATAIGLARRGRRVACIEPKPWPRSAVGESLEFSAPGLLSAIGVDTGCVDGHPPLFPKDSVEITGSSGEMFAVWPPHWFARPPIWCSRITYHSDRRVLDLRLLDLATEQGVAIVPERVTRVDHGRDTIRELVTDRGTRITADWFIDATGHTRRLFGRALGLDIERLGPSRAAFWTRVPEPPENHSTRLSFAEGAAGDLAWAWEIPLNPSEISIGTVMSARALASLRRGGLRPREVFEAQLEHVGRLRRIVAAHPDSDLDATNYTPYRHRRSIGANWLLVGDASAMVDPLTSNGVTSALRHADLAARIASDAIADRRLTRRQTWTYQHTAPATVATVDLAIESFVYRPALRRRVGLRPAVTLYAATGVVTNALYARIGQTSTPRALASAAMLALGRLWIRVGRTTVPNVARLGSSVRRDRPSGHRRPIGPEGGTARSRPAESDRPSRRPSGEIVRS